MEIIKNYRNVPKPIKASFWFLIASIFVSTIRFFITPILTRIMNEDDYGIIALFNAWQMVFNVVITLSLSAGVFNNGLLDFKNDRARFSSSILILSSVSSIIWYLLCWMLRDFFTYITNLTIVHMNIMFLGFLVNPAMGFWAAEQKFDYKYKKLTVVTILSTLFSQMLGVFAAVYVDTEKATALIVISGIVNAFFSLLIYIFILYRGKFEIKLQYWKYVLIFNLPLIPHYLSFFVLSQCDRIMIAKMVGLGEAGIYTLGYTAASILQVLYAAINSSLSPYTLKMMQEDKHSEIGQVANGILVLYGIVCVFFTGLTPEIVDILAPPSYAGAVWVIPPVIIGLYFFITAGFFTNIEFYYKKTFFVMLSTIIAGAINILLNFILIPEFGYMAAAYNTAVCYFLFFMIHYYLLKAIECNPIYDIKFIFQVSFIVILIIILLMLFFQNLFIRLSILSIILIIIYLKKDIVIKFSKNINSLKE